MDDYKGRALPNNNGLILSESQPRFCKSRGTLFILWLSWLAVEVHVLFPWRLAGCTSKKWKVNSSPYTNPCSRFHWSTQHRTMNYEQTIIVWDWYLFYLGQILIKRVFLAFMIPTPQLYKRTVDQMIDFKSVFDKVFVLFNSGWAVLDILC